MPIFPEFKQFESLSKNYSMAPVYRRLLSDSLTPVTGLYRLDSGGPAFLFESVVGGERVGRFSFLATQPFQKISATRDLVTISTSHGTEQRRHPDPLSVLNETLRGFRGAHLPELPPFCGGAVGFASYDVVRYVESLPHPPHDDRGLPDLDFYFFDRMVIFDNVDRTMYVVAMARFADHPTLKAAYDDAVHRVDEWVQLLSTDRGQSPMADAVPHGQGDGIASSLMLPVSNFSQEAFERAVEKCVEYIRAGDVFQVVPSQRFQVPLRCDPREVYRTLRFVNPSPFMFFLRTDDCTLVGSSPEVLCRVYDGRVTVRPLAGTRRRGASEAEDRALERELLADEKEIAEHVMLVDLGRNDVGRVSELGSIKLDDVMHVERYSHVMHISSNVSGDLRSDCDAFDALKACLPAGTVSGAPKVRAMEIIDEIEPNRRGPYAGAVGYFDYSGNMDTCIALRTIVIQNGTAYIQAGAGIVADSQPTAEYQETINKAKALLRAIEITERRMGIE